METTADSDPYSDAALLRTVAAENATLRELLAAVAGDLERLAGAHPGIASMLQTRAMRLRRRLHEARPVIGALLVAVLLACKSAAISTPAPIHAAGDPERTRAAIMQGMNAAGWEYGGEEGRTVYASLYVSNHRADVAISYSEESIQFAYRGSASLGYDPGSGRIHKAYNRWVAALRYSVASAVTRVEGGDYPVKIEPAP